MLSRTDDEKQAVLNELYPDSLKTCGYCDTSKPFTEFTVDVTRKGEMRSYCKDCYAAIFGLDRTEVQDLKEYLERNGTCCECGYDKYYRALDFAHFDREDKYKLVLETQLGFLS